MYKYKYKLGTFSLTSGAVIGLEVLTFHSDLLEISPV